MGFMRVINRKQLWVLCSFTRFTHRVRGLNHRRELPIILTLQRPPLSERGHRSQVWCEFHRL